MRGPCAALMVLALGLCLSEGTEMQKHTYVIVGAGPAGLQLAREMQIANMDYVVLEKGDAPGMFFKTFPRHRTLISINKPYVGSEDPEFALRHDWNSLLSNDTSLLMTKYTEEYYPHADVYVQYLADYASKFQLNIEYNVEVTKIQKKGKSFIVSTNGKTYSCRAAVVATGLSKPFIPKVKGMELAQGYEDCSVNPADYKDKKVMILGKGNSALEVANNLTGVAHMIHLVSSNPIRFAYQTHFPGDVRSINLPFLDTYQLKSQNSMLEADLDADDLQLRKTANGIQLLGHDDLEDIDEPKTKILNPSRATFDVVIRALGFRFDTSIIAHRVTMDKAKGKRGKYPKMRHDFSSESLSDLYFAGAIMGGRDGKKSSGSFIHGFRYNVRFLAKFLREKYEKVPFPRRKLVRATPEVLGAAILQRAQRSSGLYQMFDFLCDVITFEGDTPVYYEEMPIHYAQERFAKTDFFTLSMEFHEEFGKENGGLRRDVHGADRVSSRLGPAAGEESNFVHPVVRYYSNTNPFVEDWMKALPMHHPKRTFIAQHHIMEDQLFDFSVYERHVEPLQRYFAGLLWTRKELRPAALSAAMVDFPDLKMGSAPTCAATDTACTSAAGNDSAPVPPEAVEIPVPQHFITKDFESDAAMYGAKMAKGSEM
eukprot:CAMPEP_0114546632 /NCGR_PEP_ID=MMETSP0114-20121206/4036_1 /TAXON_ID=31324 /ORGANISM="Goniomonas sp, Strain m" /LENGTH=652 /DNA_ID=CAMNT_0001731137 /DNA_START=14 /DNA_END=1972 /DNA_ORIENTATION=+